MQDIPYFMKNKEWYYLDKKTGKFILTEKAPKKAAKSYDEYYKDYETMGEDD